MCDPISATAVAGGASFGEAGFQYLGDRAQYKANKKLNQLAIGSANEAYLADVEDAADAYQQAAASASFELQEASIDSARARSTARVSAGEAGVSGASVRELTLDYLNTEARYRAGVEQRIEFEADERDRLSDRAYRNYKNNLLHLPKPSKPNIGSYLFKAGLSTAKQGAVFAGGM